LKRANKYLVIGFVAAVIAACSSTSNILAPAETDLAKVKADFPNATIADLQHGFSLYKQNCSGCHLLYLPSEKTKEQWVKVLPEMFGKTSLKTKEREQVTQYLFAKATSATSVTGSRE
jgi:hypothetical protein